MKLKIDGEEYEVNKVNEDSVLPIIEIGNMEFYLASDSESAGEAVRQRWIDMKDNDKEEFRCMIGDDRLIQWACDKSDSYGFSNFNDFLTAVAKTPEEELASYDSNECEVTEADQELIDKLGFTPTVAYRHN